MSRLIWDGRPHEFGLDRGVFYPKNGAGVVWNGLVSIKENSADLNQRPRYLDGVKLGRRNKIEDFSGTIEAFTYPDSFYEDILTQKRNQNFGLSYRITNDAGHKIHLVYNVLIAPMTYIYRQSESDPFAWDFTTKSVPVPGSKLSAHLIVDTSKAYSSTVESLENVLYGTDSIDARIPTPFEVFDIFEENSILQIIDHGDGTFTAIGPDDVVQMIDETTFKINWTSAIFIDEVSYTLYSL